MKSDSTNFSGFAGDHCCACGDDHPMQLLSVGDLCYLQVIISTVTLTSKRLTGS